MIIQYLNSKSRFFYALLFSICIIGLVLLFRYRKIDEYQNICIYEDLWLSEWFSTSRINDVVGKKYYVITNKNKPLILIYHDYSDHYRSLLIRNSSLDSVEVSIYGSCAQFILPLERGKVTLSNVRFKGVKCIPLNFEILKHKYFHDYNTFYWPWFE